MADPSNTGRINILCIDDGGIRGIIPAAILAALQESISRDLHEVFDLISGTSTGHHRAWHRHRRPQRPSISSF